MDFKPRKMGRKMKKYASTTQVDFERNDEKNNIASSFILPDSSFENGICICVKCHKLCLITPNMWLPSTQEVSSSFRVTMRSPKTFHHISSNITLSHDIERWSFNNYYSLLKQELEAKNCFMFPCCQACSRFFCSQLSMKREFYTKQNKFFDSFLSSDENKNEVELSNTNSESVLQNSNEKESSGEDNKNDLENNKRLQNGEKNEFFIDNKKDKLYFEEKLKAKIEKLKKDSSILNEVVKSNRIEIQNLLKSSQDTNLSKATLYPLYQKVSTSNLKNEEDSKINSTQVSKRLLQTWQYSKNSGFSGVTLAYSFHISTRRHYGCINNNRIGACTPKPVPSDELERGLFFFAQLVKAIATFSNVETNELILSTGVSLLDTSYNSKFSFRKFKSNNDRNKTDNRKNEASVDENPNNELHLNIDNDFIIINESHTNESDNNKNNEEENLTNDQINNHINNQTIVEEKGKSNRRNMEGKKEVLLPLNAPDIKSSKSVNEFNKAMKILLPIIWKIFESPTILGGNFFPPYPLENEGLTISGHSLLLDKRKPYIFTEAMKWLLFDLKYIQMRALQLAVSNVSNNNYFNQGENI
ncbi:hypothetical protein TRFO_40730 [Tritrichomonas foetus]|uniref:Atg6 BARA domain-containing protein n=1 Tax=Tritrichomonas foetus TaxID=1144522 RepID=A0A1J4J5L0_9EUKA|nr:hypothetical protein TRFO_40730 [Tritrichomonas foetus]|eukprot:OHS92923.1 hypothetical protein TRFO_40730 [Tritrichomonas foetus]